MDKVRLVSDLEAHVNALRYEVEEAQDSCKKAMEMRCTEVSGYEAGYADGVEFAVTCLVNLMELHGIEI